MMEKFFEELGYFSEQTCKSLQVVMNGKSFHGFDVGYSSHAGNCTLIVKSERPETTADELGRCFVSMAFSELGEIARKKHVLETYIMKHVEKSQRIVFFMERHQYTAWFVDAKVVSVLLGIRKCVSEPDGYEFVYIDRERFRQYADYITEQGWEWEFVDITGYGR